MEASGGVAIYRWVEEVTEGLLRIEVETIVYDFYRRDKCSCVPT